MTQANTRKVLSAVDPSHINVRSLVHGAEDYRSADLFMKTSNGDLKAVEFWPSAQSGMQQSSVTMQRSLYAQALARYISEQERQGNKFFIRQPSGTIQHLSVATKQAQ